MKGIKIFQKKRREHRLHGLKGLPKNSYPRLSVFIPAKIFEIVESRLKNWDDVSGAKAVVTRIPELGTR